MWQSMADWIPQTTLSEAEVLLQETRAKLHQELASLDKGELAAVEVLADDPDPARALAKIEAMRRLGIIKTTTPPTKAEVTNAKEKKP